MLKRLYVEILYMLVEAKRKWCIRRIKKAKTPDEMYYWALKGLECIIWRKNFHLCEIGIG